MENTCDIDIATLTPYKCKLPWKNKVQRLCWRIVYLLLFRPLRLRHFNPWRLLLLRCFGARMDRGCVVHATAEVWAPWNLEMGSFVCLAPHVICYNPARIVLGSKVTVSQYAHLCTASHDITQLDKPLLTKPIKVEDFAWIAADAFIGPGVTIRQGAVVGARAAVFKDVEPWTVVGGNPARFIKKRELKNKP